MIMCLGRQKHVKMRGVTLVGLGGKLVRMRLSTVCKTFFHYSLIQEITTLSLKVQNVVV